MHRSITIWQTSFEWQTAHSSLPWHCRGLCFSPQLLGNLLQNHNLQFRAQLELNLFRATLGLESMQHALLPPAEHSSVHFLLLSPLHITHPTPHTKNSTSTKCSGIPSKVELTRAHPPFPAASQALCPTLLGFEGSQASSYQQSLPHLEAQPEPWDVSAGGRCGAGAQQ